MKIKADIGVKVRQGSVFLFIVLNIFQYPNVLNINSVEFTNYELL